MKLSQLSIFASVCKYGNLTKAAEVLKTTQPAISYVIKELEQEYKLKLVMRKSHGFELTKEGEEFLRIARVYLAQASIADMAFKDLSNKFLEVRIGTPPMLGVVLFPVWYESLKKDIPQLRVQRYEFGTNTIKTRLERGTLDCAIYPSDPKSEEEFNYITIASYKYVLCVSLDHPLANRKSISVRELVNEPIEVLDKSYSSHYEILKLFTELDLKPTNIIETTQFSAMRKDIVCGNAIGFIYSDYYEYDRDGLVAIEIEEETESRNTNFYWNKNRHNISGLSAIIDILEKNNKLNED